MERKNNKTNNVAKKCAKVSRKRTFQQSSSKACVSKKTEGEIQLHHERSNRIGTEINRPVKDTADQPLRKKIKNKNKEDNLTVEFQYETHDSLPLHISNKIKNEFELSLDVKPRYARAANDGQQDEEIGGQSLRKKFKNEPGTSSEFEGGYEINDSSLLGNNGSATCQRQFFADKLIKLENDDQENTDDKPIARMVKEEPENDWTVYESGYNHLGSTDDESVPFIIRMDPENDVATERQYETKDSSLLDNNSPVTYQRRVLTNQLIKTEHDDQEDKNDKTTVRKIKEEWENDWTRYENGYKDRGNTDDKLVPLVIKKEQKNDVAAELCSEVATTSYACGGSLPYPTPGAEHVNDEQENDAECRLVTVKEELKDDQPVRLPFHGVHLLYLAIKNSSREYATYREVETFIRRWFPYYAHESLLIIICSMFIRNKSYFTCKNGRTADDNCSVWTVNEECVDVLERELTYLAANYEREVKSTMTDSDRLPELLKGYGAFKLGYSHSLFNVFAPKPDEDVTFPKYD